MRERDADFDLMVGSPLSIDRATRPARQMMPVALPLTPRVMS
jgi:hypothetical protein